MKPDFKMGVAVTLALGAFIWAVGPIGAPSLRDAQNYVTLSKSGWKAQQCRDYADAYAVYLKAGRSEGLSDGDVDHILAEEQVCFNIAQGENVATTLTPKPTPR
jgi:hypothetical protein